MGELQLTPAEFASFTPRELQWRIEGFKRRDDRALYHLATLAAWVFGAIGSRQTAETLIGGRGAHVLPPMPPLPTGPDEDD